MTDLVSAKEAKEKLDRSPYSDWYDWWFGSNKWKIPLGIIIIASILTPLLIAAIMIHQLYLVTNNVKGLTTLISQNVSTLLSGIIVTIGIMVGILLLPSIKKFKVGSTIELETVRIDTKNVIGLKPSSKLPMMHIDTPLRDPLTSFRIMTYVITMPLQYLSRDAAMPTRRR